METPTRAPQPTGKRIGLPCHTCGKRIRYFLAEPYRLDLDRGEWTPKDSGPATYSGIVPKTIHNAVLRSECESCRLARATDDHERDALKTKLSEMQSIAEFTGIAGTPFTMQEDRWLLRDDRAELTGFSVTSYGIWFLPIRDVSELEDMRFMHVQVAQNPPVLKLYPLEIVEHPEIPAKLYVRWDGETGRKWTEIEGERGATIEQLKRLMDGLALYRLARPVGRRHGRRYSRSDFLDAYVGYYHATSEHPDQSKLAAELGISPKTVRRILADGGEEWSTFEASARQSLRTRTVRVKSR